MTALIHPDTQERVISETTTGAGITSREGSILGDSLIASLWVTAIAGTLDVSVYTLTDTGKEVLLVAFPTITAPTPVLLMDGSGISMQRIRVRATYTGVCSYEVYVRAMVQVVDSEAQEAADRAELAAAIAAALTPATSGTVRSVFSTALAVPSAATQTVLTYTVPTTNAYLLRAEMSGTNIATYNVLVNGSPLARTRTYFSGDFVGTVQLGESLETAYKIVTGDVVTVQVTNFRPTSGDFEARLQLIEL